MRRVAVVVAEVAGAGLRFLRAGLALPDVRLGLVTREPLDRCPPDVRRALAGHWQVECVLDAEQLRTAGRGIAGQLGGLDRFFAVQEHVQFPAALARAELGVPGMAPDTVARFRDKARMKEALRAARVPCARGTLARGADEARAFVRDCGFPVVAKPPSGAGAADTHRIADAAAFETHLPRFEYPVLLEEFLTGDEFAFDSVWLDGKMLWHSTSAYLPSCLEVKQNPWMQWTVLLPRHIDGPEYDPIRAAGAAALRALGMQSGMSHMEWFWRPGGGVAIGEAGARPPGAQFTTLLGLAHDTDFYAAWMRLMIHGEFAPPQRRFAAGAAYLRAPGQGRIRGVRGVTEIGRKYGRMIAEIRLPEPGTHACDGYEGQGFILLRHEETEAVAVALQEIVSTVRVDLA